MDGVFTTLWMFATLLFGGAALGLMPTAIVGGMLLYIGIDLVSTWLIEVHKKLPSTDYAVVCLIALTIVLFGFVEGVAVGMLATLVLFPRRGAGTCAHTHPATGPPPPGSAAAPAIHRRLLRIYASELLQHFCSGHGTPPRCPSNRTTHVRHHRTDYLLLTPPTVHGRHGAGPSRPRRPERAYMDILKNVTRTILRCHTSRWMTTFPGANMNLADLVTRGPSCPLWPCRRFRVRSSVRGRLPSATGPWPADA